MTSSPCLKFVAVTSAGSAEEKGTIDVWSVDSNGSSTADGKSLSCTTIQAHEKKTIRGLKFVVDTDNQGLLQMKDHHFLLSATLQGEVKVWRYQVHRINDCCNDFDATLSTSTSYMCTRTIKVPGKIFSLAVYAPSLFGLVTKEDVYLAMGQSRGQVRVMRINLWSHEKDETVDRSALHNSSSGNETSNLIRSASSSNTEDREDSTINENSSSNDALQDFLSLDVVGEQSHHDNIKLLTFSPDGRHLVASRAYDARIWFHSFQVNNDSR
jgi:WD40 repeat protein